MADSLDTVTQQFVADVAEYLAALDAASATAQEFADANEAAKVALDGLRDHGIEAGAALGHVRDESLEAAAAEKELGDSADAAAAKLDLMGLAGASSYSSLIPLLGIIGAIVIAAAAVAPAVAAMGLGFAAAGVFALPTIMQITGGLKTIAKDQAAVNNAMTATAKNTALAKLHKDWAAIPAPIQDVITAVKGLEATWKQVAKEFQPEVLTAVNEGLAIARDLMREIMPLASQGFFAINGALEQIKAAIDSSGFKQFLADMAKMVVPATNAIMHLALTILGVLGNALEQLAPLSVPFINLVSAIVQALGGPAAAALKVVVGLILGLGQAIEPLLPGLSQVATLLINDIGSSFQAFLPIISQVIRLIGGSLIKILQDLTPIIANALTPNGPFMMALAQLPVILNAILPLFTGLASVLSDPWIAQAAVWVISLVIAFKGLMGVLALARTGFALLTAVMEVNPVILILTGIALLVLAFIELWNHSAAFRNFWIGLWHDILVVVDAAVNFIVSHWKLLAVILATVLLGPVAGLVVFLATHFGEVKRIIGDVISWIAGHWKEIVAWLVDPVGMAVHMLLTHTHQIAQAFDQMRHDVAAVLAGARHDVASAFDDVRHSIAAFVGWLPHAIASAWDAAHRATDAALAAVGHLIASAFDLWRHTVATGISNVLSFFEKLPGQIVSFLASLPGKMLSIGENVIKGLINGILAAAAQIPSIMAGLASSVASYFTNPLKLFSPSRLFFDHGWNIVQGAINGVKANAPALMATMRGLGTGVGAAGTGSSLAAGAIAPAGGSTSVHVTVPTTVQGATSSAYSSPEFTQYMQAQVQEAVLRYGQLNPGNGLTPAWGR